jgi:hypothetical protein
MAMEKEIDKMCMGFYDLSEDEKIVILGHYDDFN